MKVDEDTIRQNIEGKRSALHANITVKDPQSARSLKRTRVCHGRWLRQLLRGRADPGAGGGDGQPGDRQNAHDRIVPLRPARGHDKEDFGNCDTEGLVSVATVDAALQTRGFDTYSRAPHPH